MEKDYLQWYYRFGIEILGVIFKSLTDYTIQQKVGGSVIFPLYISHSLRIFRK